MHINNGELKCLKDEMGPAPIWYNSNIRHAALKRLLTEDTTEQMTMMWVEQKEIDDWKKLSFSTGMLSGHKPDFGWNNRMPMHPMVDKWNRAGEEWRERSSKPVPFTWARTGTGTIFFGPETL